MLKQLTAYALVYQALQYVSHSYWLNTSVHVSTIPDYILCHDLNQKIVHNQANNTKNLAKAKRPFDEQSNYLRLSAEPLMEMNVLAK